MVYSSPPLNNIATTNHVGFYFVEWRLFQGLYSYNIWTGLIFLIGLHIILWRLFHVCTNKMVQFGWKSCWPLFVEWSPFKALFLKFLWMGLILLMGLLYYFMDWLFHVFINKKSTIWLKTFEIEAVQGCTRLKLCDLSPGWKLKFVHGRKKSKRVDFQKIVAHYKSGLVNRIETTGKSLSIGYYWCAQQGYEINHDDNKWSNIIRSFLYRHCKALENSDFTDDGAGTWKSPVVRLSEELIYGIQCFLSPYSYI